jgi:Flp pilus assembly protein TadD
MNVVVFIFLFLLFAVICPAQALTESERSVDALNKAGIDQYKRGNFAAAEEKLVMAIALEPQNAITHYNLGTVYFQMKRLEKAKTVLETALRLAPNNPAILNQLGVVRTELGEHKGALRLLKRAFAIDPTLRNTLYNLGCLQIRTGVYRDAIRNLERARGLPGFEAEVGFNLAYAYGKLKKYRRAIDEARKVLTIAPNDEQARLMLVVLYVAAKDKSSAMAEYRTTTVSNPPLARRMFGAIHGNRVIFLPNSEKSGP